ncbi:hypothetical protein KP509_1Z264300 [Ceratopteris richardii]|nr:hypothetical protein KP509_1Z264300 [Ceratopteris richardii]
MVFYIDTCNSFSPSRMVHILHGLLDSNLGKTSVSVEEALKLVVCSRVHDIFLLLRMLNEIDSILNRRNEVQFGYV